MRRAAVIGIVAVAILAAAGGIAWWVLSRPAAPDATARAFVEALAAGDGGAAAALLEQAPAPETLDAFGGATAYIDEPMVTGVGAAEGEPVAADVTFVLDGAQHDARLGLVETAAGWAVAANSLASLTASTALGDAVRVGGVLVPAGEPIDLLPGVYPVVAAPDAALVGSAAAVALPGEQVAAAVTPTLAPGALADAQSDLDAYADSCTRAAAEVPDACGIRIPWAADLARVTSITYRIEAYPTLVLADDLSGFDATGGVLVATATGVDHDGADASFTYATQDWTLRGDVDFRGDEMVLAVR
ncbi:hypothetical protein [Microbacterium hominis]|uniref:Uncharacterized protein n=1 Tax=Microbacterium hominis TaxID=162426 RepID=A0A7D4PTQ4_9MICO|nr:hypothetical protein [Microbacterium hominis]QKJ19053.1 hypothetical protein HQM25_06470 [Microbacterium hominis]